MLLVSTVTIYDLEGCYPLTVTTDSAKYSKYKTNDILAIILSELIQSRHLTATIS